MINRRKFIQSTLLTSASLAITNKLFGNQTIADKYQIDLGVCAEVDKNNLIFRNNFTFLEESVSRFLAPREDDEHFNANLSKLKESKLKVYAVNGFLPGDLKCVGPDDNTDKILTFAETTFSRMQKAETKILVFGSGGSRRIPEGFDPEIARKQFISINKKIAPLAEKYKVTIVLEPLNYGETNLLNTLEEGITYTSEVNHPNIRLLADFFHMLRNGETAASVLKAGELLLHTHIAEKENRTAPGVAGDDFRSFFAALKQIGYKGKLAVECRWKDMEQELPLAYKTIQDQMPS